MISPERYRPGDQDRDLIIEQLREHHLAGRLDTVEFERRLERCLAAPTYLALNATIADLPDPRTAGQSWWGPRRQPVVAAGPPPSRQRRKVRHALRGLAQLIALLVLAIWVLTSPGTFWPAWVWLGLGIPVALDAAIRWAWRFPRGAVRRAVVVGTVLSVIESTLIVVWALESLDAGAAAYFWPVWPLLGIGTVIAVIYVLFRAPDGRPRR
jgi:Domain of unknown function (DUF1707)